MADSLRASAVGLDLIDQARRQRRWNKTASAWYQQAFTSRSTLNRFWAGQLIRSEAFMALCDVVGVPWEHVADLEKVSPETLARFPSSTSEASSVQARHPHVHWGEAPDTQIFYGREADLATLHDWVTKECCRFLLIQGMGGMGKTMLAARLVHDLLERSSPAWDWVVWRSLRNAPPFALLLNDILGHLDPKQAPPDTVLESQLKLLDCLRHHKGILVLDNLESILSHQPASGVEGPGTHYAPGYETYGELLRLMGESAHQSCVILTSREIPRTLVNQLGRLLPMRRYSLTGLKPEAIQFLFRDKGQFTGSAQDWRTLSHYYCGNPLALKIVATSVRDFFDGNLAEFLADLQDDSVLFEDIKTLLDCQFNRLNSAEQALMYWLAINREPTSLPALQQDIHHLRKSEILTALASLQHCSLVDKQGTKFTQQPVVMEYVLARLIEDATQAILNADATASTLRHYAFAKAQSKDYLYDSQTKLVLKPIYERVSQSLTSEGWCERTQTFLRQWQRQPHQCLYGPGNFINLLRAGGLSLRGLDFSALPVWQANLQGIDLKDVSFAQSDLTTSVLTEMTGNVLSAAFSHEGAILGTSDNGYRIRLWDVRTGQLLNICQGHTHWIRSVCFSPQQSSRMLLASGSADCTVRVWDVKTGTELHSLAEHTDEVFCVTFCPKGTLLLSASGDRTLRLWEIETEQCIHIFEGHQHRVRTIACGQERIIASGDESGIIRIWDLYTGDHHRSITAHNGWVRSIQFTTDGLTLVSGGNDGVVRLWDVKTGDLKQEWLAHPGGVYSLSLSVDDHLLATGGADHQIRLWQMRDGAALTTISGHGNQIYSVAFSPDTQTLAGVSLDQTVKLWDWKHHHCLKTWRGYTDWGFPIDVTVNGQILVSGSGANQVHIWDLQQQKCLQSLSGFPSLVRSVVTLPNDLLAVAGANPVIQVWNWSNQHCVRQLRGHQDWVLGLAMWETQPGAMLASCSADRSVRLWTIETGKEEAVLLGHQDQVNAIAFSPRSSPFRLLASGSSDHQVKLWDWQTGSCLKTLEGHQHRVYAVCFHPTQPWLISAGADMTIRLWDIESGECLQVLQGHQGWIFAIAVSPCGAYLLSGGQDQQVKLWDIDVGQCIRSFTGHRHQVYSVTFGPDGDWCASGSQDQTIRIWDVQTGEGRYQLSARLYEGMNISGTKGLSIAQRLTLEELGATCS